MKKSYIKQIVAASVCVAVVIAALLIPVDFKRASAGAGNGQNAKIEKLEELSSAIYGFDVDLLGSGKIGATPESNYKSITFNQVTSAVVDSSTTIKEKNGVDTTNTTNTNEITLNRNVTAYLAENSSYYSIDICVSQGYFYQKDLSDMRIYNDEISYVRFNTEIYIEESFAAVRFVRAEVTGHFLNTSYHVSASGGVLPWDGEILTNSNIKKVLDKWIFIPAEAFTDFGDLLCELTGSIFTIESKDYPSYPIKSAAGLFNAESNFNMLWFLADGMRNSSNFDVRGKIYEMDESSRRGLAIAMSYAMFQGFSYNSIGEKFDELASITVDLGDSVKPSALMRHRLSFQTPYDKEAIETRNYSSFSEDSITFKNIGNTKVKAPNVKNALSLEKFYGLMEK